MEKKLLKWEIYTQIITNKLLISLSIVNPLKYIYFFESFLIKKVEKKIFSKFDKIILFSKNEIKKTRHFEKKNNSY